MARDVPVTDVTLLAEPPGLARLFAKAVLTAAGRPGARAGLPDGQVVCPEVRQDVARLAAYNRVCGFALRNAVPATWLHVLTFPLQVEVMAARDFPFALPGLVHVRNRMELRRPVRVTDALTLSARAANLAPHRSGVTVDLVGEARVGDELVWTGVSTYLARGARMEGQADEAPELPLPQAPPSARWRVPGDVGRRYAAVSGDINPMHLNPLAAKAFGFPRALAHGMWTHARALAALEPRLPQAYAVSVAFRKPLLVPAAVAFGAERQEEAWAFAVTSRDGEREHLRGGVRPVSTP